jgi:hypothetical protein
MDEYLVMDLVSRIEAWAAAGFLFWIGVRFLSAAAGIAGDGKKWMATAAASVGAAAIAPLMVKLVTVAWGL